MGLKGFEVVPWVTLFGPARLPPELVTRISTDVLNIAAAPDMRDRMKNLGLEASVKGPQELREFLPKDTEKWGEMVRRSGAKIDLGG
jgi:tripartite-type tricarboxylate transporter receptor subunit TctC